LQSATNRKLPVEFSILLPYTSFVFRRNEGPGAITVHYGAMFSGKTAAATEFFRLAQLARIKVQAFKPSIGTRTEGTYEIRGRGGVAIPATPIHTSVEIIEALKPNTGAVVVDEAQFLDNATADIITEISLRGIRVCIAGLPTNFRGEPFGPMPNLISIAHQAIQHYAICTFELKNEREIICGENATQTQRLIGGQPANYDDPVTMVGDNELYEARCPEHHFVPGRPRISVCPS
jgi:thymidine kinase